ncbi:MAG: TetR/AcrR family transcriptional regulator [Solirubrobacteraceae bacterium]
MREEPSTTVEVAGGSLYPKLPPGPSLIPREELEEIQRARLRGAVIHVAARDGLALTSTRKLCRLAGVSERTLYERFHSKQGCVQAAYDDVLEGVVNAMKAARGELRDPRERTKAMIAAFQAAAIEHPHGRPLALLVAEEAAESDAKGPMRLVDHLGKLLRESYEPGRGPPEFVIRGAATAVMSVTRSWVFNQREDELGDVAEQLSGWLDGYRCEGTAALGGERSELLRRAARMRRGAELKQTSAVDATPEGLGRSSKRALGMMARGGASDRDWAAGTCLAYFDLLSHVHGDPASARLAFVDAPRLGPDADGERERMIQAAVDLYIRRAPAGRVPSQVIAHAVVGASWGLLHDHLEERDGQPGAMALCEQFSYLALAPVLGGEWALSCILDRRASLRRRPARA